MNTTVDDLTLLDPELKLFYDYIRRGTAAADWKVIIKVQLQNTRKKIRWKNNFFNINISKLVAGTKGDSGADIEGVVKDSIENTFTDGKAKLTTDYILTAISETHSLSEIMKDSLDTMSKVYKDRKNKKCI